MFYQIFLSPQVKQCAIITYKHGTYELPHKMLNDLKLRILGNKNVSRKSLKSVELEPSAQLATRNENFDSCATKLQKIVLLKILQKNFAEFREFVNIALPKILVLRNWCLLLSIGVNYFT